MRVLLSGTVCLAFLLAGCKSSADHSPSMGVGYAGPATLVLRQDLSPSAPPASPPAGEDEGGHSRAHVTRAPDRRRQRRWVPFVTGWLCLLIGLADIVGVAIPSLHLHHRLHRITVFVPGTLTNVTATATVIVGLLLILLSHALRRRKRRAD